MVSIKGVALRFRRDFEAVRSLQNVFAGDKAEACANDLPPLSRFVYRALYRRQTPSGTVWQHQAQNMKANKIFAGIIVGIILLASSPFILGLLWPRINDVRTGETPQYPDIQPQRFNQPSDKVFAAALSTAQAAGWEIRLTEPQQGIIEAVATTRLLKFKDDVTITVTQEQGASVVNVRSKSRIGKGDLGTNARRIRAFQAELAKRL